MEEAGNCHLYEKPGYKKTGKTQTINEKMILVFFEKKKKKQTPPSSARTTNGAPPPAPRVSPLRLLQRAEFFVKTGCFFGIFPL
ncbi:MAG: hypothetical protein J6Z04_07610 [Clostridia bacterium]|nr:hypothetical protein [Clostridia bacterium]